MKLTSSRQRNAISEGFALGLLRNGLSELPRNKPDIDLAFDHAWRKWPHSHLYPQISRDLKNGSDGINIITHSGYRSQTWHFYWDKDSHPISVVARHELSSQDEVNDLADSIDGDLPLSEWINLVRLFLDRIEHKR